MVKPAHNAQYVFERPNKNTFISSMKQNCNLNHFQQLLFHTFPPPPDPYTGAKTAPRLSKFGYFDGRVAKVSSRLALANWGPAWSVILMVETDRKRKNQYF